MGCSQSKSSAANSPSEVRSVPPSPAPAPKPSELPAQVKPTPSAIQSPIPSKPAPVQHAPEPPKASEEHVVPPPAPVEQKHVVEVHTPERPVSHQEPVHHEPVHHEPAPQEPVHQAPVHHEPTPEPPPPVRINKPAPPAAEEPVHVPAPHVEPAHPVPVVHHAPVESKPVVHAAPEPVVHHSPAAAVSSPATMISPNVGFVIKTKDLTTGEKIFINILYHEKVTEMIPVDAKESTDKKGERCLAYSVVLASSLFQLSHKYDSPEINQVSLSSIDLINKTYKINLDSDYKIPRMKRGFVGDEVEDVALPAHITAAASFSAPTATDVTTEVHVPEHKQSTPPPLPAHHTPAHAPEPEPEPVVTPAAAPAAVKEEEEVKQEEPVIPSETTPAVAPAAVDAVEEEVQSHDHHHHTPEPEPVVHHTPEKAHVAPAVEVPTATDEATDFVVPAPKPVPPKMHGWLKKRGHVVLNWKSRYFVLDNGYLTYFVDKLDHPPYGKDMKGQLCLAGYREVPITEETAGSSASKRNTSAAEEALWTNRLHLVYDPALFDSEGSKSKATSNSEDDYQDLLLEAASPDEKAAWLSAINAHTEYFESTLTLGANLLANKNGSGAASPAGGAASGPNTPTHGNRTSTMSVAAAPRLQSIAGRSSTSSYSVVDDNKRWMLFLHSGEEIVLTGLTAKPNPMGIHLMRQLILTSHKRLLYIDGKTMEQKGEIEWSNDITAQYPQIKLLDDSTFEIAESAKKTYKFITKDMLNAKDWVHAVDTTVKK